MNLAQQSSTGSASELCCPFRAVSMCGFFFSFMGGERLQGYVCVLQTVLIVATCICGCPGYLCSVLVFRCSVTEVTLWNLWLA